MLPAPSADSTALVTGASSGLGVDLARSLARRGHHVTLVARREDRLTALAAELTESFGVGAAVIACDLGDADARERLVAQVAAGGRRVDVLVNNAGYGSGAPFVDLDRESEVAMIRLNCEAVVDLCGRYAPAMAERGAGAILNVASVVSFQPIPRQATYSASKAMVRAFSEALHTELRGSGVTVTALCPGGMKTEFIAVAGVESSADGAPDFVFMAAADVAEQGIVALEAGRRVVVPGLVNRVTSIAGTHSPHSVLLRVMDRFYPVGR